MVPRCSGIEQHLRSPSQMKETDVQGLAIASVPGSTAKRAVRKWSLEICIVGDFDDVDSILFV